MTEQTTTIPIIDKVIDELVVETPKTNDEIVKSSPHKKATPRATRTKSTSKKRKPTSTKERKTNSKVKETKEKATKEKGAKDKVTKPAKETKEKPTKPSTPTLGQLSMWHQLILYTMRRMNREVTYSELGNETGLSRAVLRRVINSQNDSDSLISKDLAVINQYETEDGETLPYYFCLTDAGKKIVS